MRWRRAGIRDRAASEASVRPSHAGRMRTKQGTRSARPAPVSFKPRSRSGAWTHKSGLLLIQMDDYPDSHTSYAGKNRPACGIPHMKKSHAEIYVAAAVRPDAKP